MLNTVKDWLEPDALGTLAPLTNQCQLSDKCCLGTNEDAHFPVQTADFFNSFYSLFSKYEIFKKKYIAFKPVRCPLVLVIGPVKLSMHDLLETKEAKWKRKCSPLLLGSLLFTVRANWVWHSPETCLELTAKCQPQWLFGTCALLHRKKVLFALTTSTLCNHFIL